MIEFSHRVFFQWCTAMRLQYRCIQCNKQIPEKNWDIINAFREQVDSYDFAVFTWFHRIQKSYTHQSASTSSFVRDDNFTECRNHPSKPQSFPRNKHTNEHNRFLLDKLNANWIRVWSFASIEEKHSVLIFHYFFRYWSLNGNSKSIDRKKQQQRKNKSKLKIEKRNRSNFFLWNNNCVLQWIQFYGVYLLW